jgi:hypothetical protein
VLAHAHDAVKHDWHQEERELIFPLEALMRGGIAECRGRNATEDQASRPTSVQDVEVMSAVVWIKRCHQRIQHSFEDAVADGEKECAPEKTFVSGCFSSGIARAVSARGSESDNGRKSVAKESDHDEFAIAEFIREQTADQNDQAEAGQSAAGNSSKFRAGEAELAAPVAENATANGEADTGGENGHEAGPKQATGVGSDSFSFC